MSRLDLNISGIRGKSSFEWKDNQPQAISADFVLSHIGLPGCGPQDEAFEQGAITLQMNVRDARMKGELLAAEHASGLAFTVALNDYRDQPGMVADVTAEANADSVIWCLSGLSQPDKGSARLTVRVDGKTPALRTAGDNWRSWLQRSTLQGQGILRLDGLDFSQKIADLNGDVEIKTELADGLGKLTLAEDSSIEVSGLDPDWVERLGMPSKLLTELKQDTKLVNLLRNAVEASSDESGWAHLAPVGSNIAKQSPEFDPRNYGYGKLGELIYATRLFDIEERRIGTTDSKALYVRDKRKK